MRDSTFTALTIMSLSVLLMSITVFVSRKEDTVSLPKITTTNTVTETNTFEFHGTPALEQ